MNDNYLDFGFFIFDTSKYDIFHESIYLSHISEIRDLIIPYLTHTYEKYNELNISEGTYMNNLFSNNDGDVVIDAGANYGVFSFFASSRGAQVYSFEPVDFTFSILDSNNQINKNSIVPIKKGLDEFSKNLKMYFNSENLGGSSFVKKNKSGVNKQ